MICHLTSKIISCAVDEMYLASLINRGREVFYKGTTDPTTLPAETILKMATTDGARSVLWDEEIGSLEVGKKVCFASNASLLIALKLHLSLIAFLLIKFPKISLVVVFHVTWNFTLYYVIFHKQI